MTIDNLQPQLPDPTPRVHASAIFCEGETEVRLLRAALSHTMDRLQTTELDIPTFGVDGAPKLDLIRLPGIYRVVRKIRCSKEAGS